MTGQEFPTIRSSRACIALALLVTATALAYGQHERVIHTFRGGSDGANPYEAALVSDASGNLYGTTANGGATTSACGTAGCGTVFRLMPPATAGGSWTENVLYSFQGGLTDGYFPGAGVIVDRAGNLFGTTYLGVTLVIVN